jgi:phage tail-like protein
MSYSMSAPGTLASAAVSAGRGAANAAQFPRLGLSMLFTVSVGSLGSLGQWTACDGLRVDFRFDRVRSGGEYGHDYILPSGISYPPVTLRRGMDPVASRKVRDWLRTVAERWQLWEGEPGPRPFAGTTVTVSLHDVYKDPEAPVAVWSLQNAYPVSWSGPSLNARTNEVAVETLVLEHEGFLAEVRP